MVGGISYKLSSDRVLDYSYNYTDTGNVENVYENGKKVAVYTYDSKIWAMASLIRDIVRYF